MFVLAVSVAGGLILVWMILYFIPIGLWFQALVSDVKISLLQLILMRWRKVPPTIIVRAMIEGKKAGLELYRDLLEAHYLAGGWNAGCIQCNYCQILGRKRLGRLVYIPCVPGVFLPPEVGPFFQIPLSCGGICGYIFFCSRIPVAKSIFLYHCRYSSQGSDIYS